jgi:hypothetical protein
MAATRDYKRLPGAGYTLISRCSLWLGRDHLLAAETTFFTETYRRFYFHDLQAVVIQESRARRDWTLILGLISGLITALFGLILLVSSLDTAGWIIFAILEFPLLAGLLVNALRGPTCKCRLQTAVQTVELPSLRRLRKAERVMDTLRPLVEQAQGFVTPDMLRSLKAPASSAVRASALAGANAIAARDDANVDSVSDPLRNVDSSLPEKLPEAEASFGADPETAPAASQTDAALSNEPENKI